MISHVPQNIYLTDNTLAENIAFGVPLKLIDMDRVRFAAGLAQISGFIESNAGSYNRSVGELGARLSGGQRQRIGIARALYKQSQILVLDEATSALDTNTESAVMESIENLDQNMTIIMIAHRLSTIQRCDRVIKLEAGRIERDYDPKTY